MSIKVYNQDFLVTNLYLQHNHDTSLLTLARNINNDLKEIVNEYNLSELNNLKDRNNIVGVVKNSLKEDLPKLITSLDDMELPKIILAKSNAVKLPEYKTQLQLSAMETIKIVNPSDDTDIKHMGGVWFEYETQGQIIIITRDSYASIDLQLELYRILNRNQAIDYKLKLFTKDSVSDFYVIDNFGSIEVMDFKNNEWQFQEENNIKVAFLDFKLKESYFKLKNIGMYRKLELYGYPVDKIE